MSMVKELAFPAGEYATRVARVRESLWQAGIDALLATHLPDVCYLTGYQTPMADWPTCLLLGVDGPLTLYACDAALAVLHTTVQDIRGVRWDQMDRLGGSLVAELLERKLGSASIGIQPRRSGLRPYLSDLLRRELGDAAMRDASDLVARVRAVKSAAEIDCLRQAARFSVAGLEAALNALAAGASENTLAAAGSEAMIQAGSEFCSIDPFVRAGRRSSVVHATCKRTPIGPGDSVVLEFGGVYQRYTAPVYGTAVVSRPPDRLRRLADACLAALDRLYAQIRPGQLVGTAARAATAALQGLGDDVEVNERHGYSVGIGFPPDWVEHSIVLTDDSEEVLQPGMVFHTPRSLRLPGVLGVGFSETILVTDTGYEVLTSHKRELVVA